MQFIEQQDYRNKILQRYENSFGTLSRIPTIKDETYFVKKTVATHTMIHYTSQKETLLTQGLNMLKLAINKSFDAKELKIIVDSRNQKQDLKTTNPALHQKLMQFYESMEFRNAIKHPSLKMSEFYQYYLDEFRKKNNMKEGEFVVPRLRTTN